MYMCTIYSPVDSSNQGKQSNRALELSFYGPPCLNILLDCPGMQKIVVVKDLVKYVAIFSG